MRKTARDVTQGNCSSSTGGHPATRGPDIATGDGLVDAQKAVLLAKVRCLTVRGPVRGPIRGPIRGIEPRLPEPRLPEPRGPDPIMPRTMPPQPRPGPAPVRPPQPIPGVVPSLEEVSLEAQAVGLSQEDIQTLEDMVIKSDIDLE